MAIWGLLGFCTAGVIGRLDEVNTIWDLHAGTGWAYLLIVAVALLDGLFPVVPAETTIIGAGALATTGRLSTVGVLVAAWVGVVAGDLVAHELARHGSTRQLSRWTRRDRPRRVLARATHLMRRRGTAVVGIGRFVPLGRASVSLVSGLAAMPRRQYLPPLVVGAAAWTGYVVGLGYFGGHAFGNPLVSVGVGVGLSFLLTAAGTAVHRCTTRRPPGTGCATRRPAAVKPVGRPWGHRAATAC